MCSPATARRITPDDLSKSMPSGVVSQSTLRLLAAELGPESPLPPFTGLQRLPDPSASPDLPPDMRERIAYGRLASPLPYALQNGYSRDLRPQEIPAIKITNDRLEALVLPGFGGRLWSLRDLVAARDLVFTNPRLQFANFALTDAWFAGGIEWNLGSTGHSATTCRPVFAGSVPTSPIRTADLGVGTHPRSGVLGRSGDAGRSSVAARFRTRP